MNIAIIGAGAMGSGIAQVAAQAGCQVVLCDSRKEALDNARKAYDQTFSKLIEKGKMTAEDASALLSRITFTTEISATKDCGLVIEAIVENMTVKQKLFTDLEAFVSPEAILASNTSSLSLTALAAACKHPSRVIGLHFFNPAPLMPLVEIIPAIQTSPELAEKMRDEMLLWKKTPVICKDTPGFLVNRVARSFYGEAIRIYEEGIADFSTIDQSMRDKGFRMGPFELMDLIGNDVNYAVTSSVFEQFYFDPRFRPSITQRKLTEAGWFGRKAGRGYYTYGENTAIPEPSQDIALREKIANRILAMLINEACDTAYLRIASSDDIDLAMLKGTNYPKGLIAWGREWGKENVMHTLSELYNHYQDDRYRISPGLRNL